MKKSTLSLVPFAEHKAFVPHPYDLVDLTGAPPNTISCRTPVEAGAYQRRLSRESSVAARKELGSKMQIKDVPAAILTRMRELTAPMAEKFAGTYGPAVVRLYRAELEKVRASVR